MGRCLKWDYKTIFYNVFNHSVTNVMKHHDICWIENNEGKG